MRSLISLQTLAISLLVLATILTVSPDFIGPKIGIFFEPSDKIDSLIAPTCEKHVRASEIGRVYTKGVERGHV